MSDADRARWDRRHAAVDDSGTAVGASMPPDALRGREAWLPPGGQALDVACGRGAVASWLAERGFAVDAVDVSGAAITAAGRRDPAVHWVRHDLDLGLPPGCTGPYDVVVCQRFRDPSLYGALRAAVAPGGLLVVTVLSEVGGEPGPFRAGAGELLAAFAGMDVLAHAEGHGLASLVARRSVA